MTGLGSPTGRSTKCGAIWVPTDVACSSWSCTETGTSART